MRKGCLWGCLGVLAIAGLTAVILATYFGTKYDVITSAPRVSTAEFASERSAIVALLDPNTPEVYTILAGSERDSAGVKYLLPYECSAILDVDAAKGTRQLTLSISPRRFAGILLKIFASQEVLSFETPGFEDWVTAGLVEEKGALVMRKRGRIAPEAIELVQEQPVPSGEQPFEVEGGHVFEVIVDNLNGCVFLGLEQLARPRERESDEGEEKRTVDPGKFAELLSRIRTARITCDFDSEGNLAVIVDIECPDEAAAESILSGLLSVRDRMAEESLEEGYVVEGEPELLGNRIHADITVRGAQGALVEQAALSVQKSRER